MLNGYNYKTVGFDKHLLTFLKIDGDAFEEIVNRLDEDDAIRNWVQANGAQHSSQAIEQWNQAMISRHPETVAKKALFLHFLKEAGGEGRKDIRTYFDLIEFDEGRLRGPAFDKASAWLSRLGYDAVLSLARIASAFSSVSLLLISSHFTLISNVVTGFCLY